MKLVQTRVYKPIHDVMQVPGELNAIARQHVLDGFKVARGPGGIVIIKLVDGEVHFVPGDCSITQLVFAN
jgi:hypothetical protein